MKTLIDTKDGAVSTAAAATVQTSAQPQVEVLHKQPTTGGSYTCNPETGELVKNDAPVAETEKE